MVLGFSRAMILHLVGAVHAEILSYKGLNVQRAKNFFLRETVNLI